MKDGNRRTFMRDERRGELFSPPLVERLRAALRAADWFDRHERWIELEDVEEAIARIEELEILCADKTASITDLIEQLQKAEAQAVKHTHPSQYDIALTSCPACYPPNQHEGGLDV